MRLYLDASPVIYVVQEVEPWAAAVEARIAEDGVETVVSDLTRLECRVKPFRDGNAAVLADFDRYFRVDVHEIVSLCEETVDRATEVRAVHRFHTPDALHLGAALISRCDAFLTNDHRLDSFPDLEIEVVEDL